MDLGVGTEVKANDWPRRKRQNFIKANKIKIENFALFTPLVQAAYGWSFSEFVTVGISLWPLLVFVVDPTEGPGRQGCMADGD